MAHTLTLREAVAALPIDDVVDIVQSWERYEEQGMIGDEGVRVATRRLLREIGISAQSSDSSIAMWMDRVAFEYYRRLARETSPAVRDAEKRC